MNIGTRVMYDEAFLETQWMQDRWYWRGTVVAVDPDSIVGTIIVRWDHDLRDARMTPAVLEPEDWAKRERRANRDWPYYVARSPAPVSRETFVNAPTVPAPRTDA